MTRESNEPLATPRVLPFPREARDRTTTPTAKRHKAKAWHSHFTDLTVGRFKLPKEGQLRVWDDPAKGKGTARGQAGLSILLSGRTRTYCATFRMNGKHITVS